MSLDNALDNALDETVNDTQHGESQRGESLSNLQGVLYCEPQPPELQQLPYTSHESESLEVVIGTASTGTGFSSTTYGNTHGSIQGDGVQKRTLLTVRDCEHDMVTLRLTRAQARRLATLLVLRSAPEPVTGESLTAEQAALRHIDIDRSFARSDD